MTRRSRNASLLVPDVAHALRLNEAQIVSASFRTFGYIIICEAMKHSYAMQNFEDTSLGDILVPSLGTGDADSIQHICALAEFKAAMSSSSR